MCPSNIYKLGEEEANARDRENRAREGGKPREVMYVKSDWLRFKGKLKESN